MVIKNRINKKSPRTKKETTEEDKEKIKEENTKPIVFVERGKFLIDIFSKL